MSPDLQKIIKVYCCYCCVADVVVVVVLFFVSYFHEILNGKQKFEFHYKSTALQYRRTDSSNKK